MTRDEIIRVLECDLNLEESRDCVNCAAKCAQSEWMTIQKSVAKEVLAMLKEKHRCSDCAHQSRGLCARTGCPTRPDVWCDGWEARGK